MTRCRLCDSDLIAEESAGGVCLGCSASCADCGATPASLKATKRGKAITVCRPCLNARGPILHPVILDGERFDWERAAQAASRAVAPDGEVRWREAMDADPGVTRCPGCGTYHWREGTRWRCAFSGCGKEWGP